jgi:hypothetical protein
MFESICPSEKIGGPSSDPSMVNKKDCLNFSETQEKMGSKLILNCKEKTNDKICNVLSEKLVWEWFSSVIC